MGSAGFRTTDRNHAGGYRADTPDVITIIEADLREVERLFAAYSAAASEADKDGIVDQIRLALAPHAAAEEILVYPAVRRAAEEGVNKAEHSIDEHQEIKRLLSQVDKMDAGDPQRDGKLRELQEAVEPCAGGGGQRSAHARSRHRRPAVGADGRTVPADEAAAATHPHRLVPGTASAQLLAGPLASVADRIRDFVAR